MNPTRKSAIMAVTSDLATDQRVHRNCMALAGMGYEVQLVGRVLPSSPPVPKRSYPCKRFKLPFTKGPLFYASYNLRLFVYLIFKKCDLIFANDLDTLPACWLASKLKGAKLVYDSHEYYTGVPELEGRPVVRRIWKTIERFIFPKLKTVITVNESIANLYRKEYGNEIHVIRNVPMQNAFQPSHSDREEMRRKMGVKTTEKLLILQGSGINRDRGAEEAVMAMRSINNSRLLLLGGGDVVTELQKLAENFGVSDKIIFLPRMPYQEMMKYTAACDLGLTFDKNTNINYRFSLPNKIFDYIRAGIPVMASRLPEVEKIVDGYGIGWFISCHEPELMAKEMEAVLQDESAIARCRKNLQLAAADLTWENELKKYPKL
ncbi:MAG: glycosyltransferase family 4 protein [Arcticibacter sp.]